MEYRALGHTPLKVSALGLGTMTFGQQTSEREAHRELDLAVAAGVNFIDAAEMYPVPPRAETQGLTESYVGSWLARTARDRVVIATKITAPGRGFGWIRGGPRVNASHIERAVDGSLRRLQTDYIDLYQIHWPERNAPIFGAWRYDPAGEREAVPIPEQLSALDAVVRAGKVRHIGLSNETPWGVMSFLRAAEHTSLPRVVSVQNAYHLMNRTFEAGLSEVCFREQVSLLAYSPLAFGYLTGKYRDPRASGRIHEFHGFGQRYDKPQVASAVEAYVELAQRVNLSPTALALAFVRQQPLVASVLVGASNASQLEENLGSLAVSLTPNILAEIDGIRLRFTDPAP